MSDYLWDKRGDADEDVARLEAMLGAFAHEPRPLRLPAGAAGPEPRRSWLSPFTPRLFAPAALAAAAALVVASLIAASVLMRPRVTDEGKRAAAPESSRPDEEARKGGRPAPLEGEAEDEGKVESAAVRNPPNAARHRKAARPPVAQRRRQKGSAAEPPDDRAGGRGLTLEAVRTRGGTSELVENARVLTKEQLVYALRFTGAKLNDVREKAQRQ